MAGEIAKSLKLSVENSKAEYVRLGNSGLSVSVPIFGAMSIGHPDWAPWVLDEEKVFAYHSFQTILAISNLGRSSHFLYSKLRMTGVSIRGTLPMCIVMELRRRSLGRR